MGSVNSPVHGSNRFTVVVLSAASDAQVLIAVSLPAVVKKSRPLWKVGFDLASGAGMRAGAARSRSI